MMVDPLFQFLAAKGLQRVFDMVFMFSFSSDSSDSGDFLCFFFE